MTTLVLLAPHIIGGRYRSKEQVGCVDTGKVQQQQKQQKTTPTSFRTRRFASANLSAFHWRTGGEEEVDVATAPVCTIIPSTLVYSTTWCSVEKVS